MAKYTLDVNRRGRQFEIEGLHVGDNGLRTFEFCFVLGGEPFSLPAECIATLYAVLPGRVTVYDSCEISGDTVVYELAGGNGEKTGLTSYEGRVESEIRITTVSEGVITSPKFSFIIDSVIQDDSAIEAQSSFSVLTDALVRVLEAESGLDSKVDRVEGTEGNVVVFGADGAIKDGETAPIIPYIFTFDETGEYDEENSAKIESIRADIEAGKNVCAYIKDRVDLLPAAVELYASNSTFIRAIFHDGNSYAEIHKLSSRIIYSYGDTYSSTFSESGIIPATQKATAEWVKEYVAEQLLIDTEVVL